MRGNEGEARRLRPKTSHRSCGQSLDWRLCQETPCRLAADTPFAELLAIGIGAAISERTRASGGWPVFPTAETSVTVIHSHNLPSASPCLSKEGDWKQHCIVK